MSIKPVKGLRSYYPTDKGPVDTYQLGRNGRVEYLAAEIAVDHLKKGCDTTEEWKKWAREKGHSNDEPGLVLSHRLGGSGRDKTNLFPKSPLLDKTIWKEHEQTAVEEADEMKKWKKIKFSARLDYPSEESTRPSALEYQYDLPSGTILYGKVKNDIMAEPKVEEEEEYEEEEEEEAEEENEEPEEPVKKAEMEASESVVPAEKEEEYEEEEEEEEEEEPEPQPFKPQIPIIETIPPTPRASIQVEKSPSPPPPPPPQYQQVPEPKTNEPVKTDETVPHELNEKSQGQQSPTKEKPAKETDGQNGIITKSDLIELIPVIGSCKLAMDTVKAAYNGDGRLALRKAVQCGISLVADFYLGRAIARHGKILANSVTEQTIIRFVSKAENQIIIVSTFKATNQLLNTLTRAMS